VERAATFAFLIDDRFFGTVTAYVAGPKAAQYEFTSALPVRLLGILLPTLSPLIDAGAPRTHAPAPRRRQPPPPPADRRLRRPVDARALRPPRSAGGSPRE